MMRMSALADRDGGHADDRTCGKALFQIVVFHLASGMDFSPIWTFQAGRSQAASFTASATMHRRVAMFATTTIHRTSTERVRGYVTNVMAAGSLRIWISGFRRSFSRAEWGAARQVRSANPQSRAKRSHAWVAHQFVILRELWAAEAITTWFYVGVVSPKFISAAQSCCTSVTKQGQRMPKLRSSTYALLAQNLFQPPNLLANAS